MKLTDFQHHIRNHYGETLNELINEIFLNAVDYANDKDEESTFTLIDTIRNLMPFSTLEDNVKFIAFGFMADVYVCTERLSDAEKVYDEGLTILNKYHKDVSELTPVKKEVLKMEFGLSDAEVKELKYHINVDPQSIEMFLDLRSRIDKLK
jgi:hypothetical protein